LFRVVEPRAAHASQVVQILIREFVLSPRSSGAAATRPASAVASPATATATRIATAGIGATVQNRTENIEDAAAAAVIARIVSAIAVGVVSATISATVSVGIIAATISAAVSVGIVPTVSIRIIPAAGGIVAAS